MQQTKTCRSAPQTATTKRPLASNSKMQGRFQLVIVVVIAAAIAWVLVSPAPDELPGTLSGRASLLHVAALDLGELVAEISGLVLTPLEIDISHRIDILAITCTRLC